jgi:hypothetical protein
MPETPFGDDKRPELDIAEASKYFLIELDHLSDADVAVLGSAGITDYSDAEIEVRDRLREELRGIADWSGRLDACREMSDGVERWATSVRHWLPAGVGGTAQARGQIPARAAAARFVLDAAYGVVLADLLKPDEAELLLRPWRDVLGDRADRTVRLNRQRLPYRAARTNRPSEPDGPPRRDISTDA